VAIENSLENSLDEANSWVNATTSDSGGDLDGTVKSKSDGESINWHILGTIMFDDLENKGNEEHSHDKFNEENLEYHLSTVIATISWAKLGDIVGSSSWKSLVILRQEDHSSSAEETSDACTNELEEHNYLSVYNTEWEVIVSVLNHHTDCYSWIKMSATNGSKHLSANSDSKTNTNWCVG